MFYLLSRTVSYVASNAHVMKRLAHSCARHRSTASGALYPAYASYKAIKSNDIQQLETWLMFWCVMGAVTVLEHSVEWIVSWSVPVPPRLGAESAMAHSGLIGVMHRFPFYYEIKTLVILWLTLPQIQVRLASAVHPLIAQARD